MYLSSWMRRWFAVVFICAFIVIGCGTYMLLDNDRDRNDPDPKYVINQVRLKVSDIMSYLEMHHGEIEHNPANRENLQALSKNSDVEMLVTKLDGKVVYTSRADESVSIIDLKYSLHYDLYTSRVDKDIFKIAFPLIDEAAQTQVGNVIFTMPITTVTNVKEQNKQPFPIIMIAFSMATLVLLFLGLRKKITNDTVEPIIGLKNYSEAILKGDYQQTAEYGRMDEIGEVYAMFDQMRMEIMDLSLRRDEQEKSQKELITNISHDIKTPLTIITAYMDAIRDGLCSDMEIVKEYVEVMKTNTDKMTRLVEDLLLHALKELGQISVNLTEQYSRSIFLSIIKPIAHHVRTTGITFIEPQHIPNVLIHVDSNRLEQVVSNLISNALKHTVAGDSISMSIDLELRDLKITILDNGAGILPQDMPFIFERYFKGQTNQSSESPNHKGTGLGLSICKYIIEAHNGSISFKSIKGEGTVFYFTIPLG
jgi:signal transduction histidine kinase